MSDNSSEKNVALFPRADGSAGAIRELPNNIVAEQNYLGALLYDNQVFDKTNDLLRPEHFFDTLHGKIFAAASKLIMRGQVANHVTLKAMFSTDTFVIEEDVDSYLGDLIDGVISISDAPDYAQLIHNNYLRRELIRISDTVIKDASQPDIDNSAFRQIEAAEQYLFNLAENDMAETGLRPFVSVLTETIRQAEIAANSDGHLSGLSTGLTGLNNLMGGMHKSDLIILAGRPGMGKTALATNIAFHAATTTRTDEVAAPVAFFSLEMSAEQLGLRILSERSELDSEKIRRGKLKTDEFNKLVDANREINMAPFFIDDTPALSISQLASRARRMKRTSGLGLIVVDYLQLLQAQIGLKPENRVQEISNITRSLKALAKELDIPVLALSQLSRAVEQRDDKRPNLADLRESGSIEQDSDLVMFVYREEYYLSKGEPEQKDTETTEKFNERYDNWTKRLEKTAGVAEIIIAKQRHGPVGTVTVHFESRLTKFQDPISPDYLPDNF
ncbi:replicative DNA helicase [Alphaproteobacteria bacterium]|jgi:replicative DNA helicase|nr:replicative DNA helicase [Alphaproteobacteria bacterium]MDA9189909.1 replicative DNA helicase [Alphaproteobacteria bacterium]MDA9815999.1 replicative DNA helicase [Alphaproteobacteria bacterium]MDC0461451.1 replicative DNA helicase [Alphaproteobacteria bacterium]